MAYVTEDKRVQAILIQVRNQFITRQRAEYLIKSLPPQKHAKIGYLDCEVHEAMSSLLHR